MVKNQGYLGLSQVFMKGTRLNIVFVLRHMVPQDGSSKNNILLGSHALQVSSAPM